MKRRILLAAAALALAVISFAAGRECPIRHYQQLGQSQYLFEVTTGRICLPLTENPVDAALKGSGVPQPVPPSGKE